MVPEAELERTDHGLAPKGEGWFVVNSRESEWVRSEGMGACCMYEGEARFDQLGIQLNVLPPGEPNTMYHGEPNQEDFLVLSGECILIIEGEERRLGPWDFVHCPPWTEHAFVGAGDEPCVMVSVGSRAQHDVRYTVDEAAIRHGAGVEEETKDPSVAYAKYIPTFRKGPSVLP